ncbi:alkaline phosphatase PafA [Mangrovimonas sp. DI 80]|uniref:alkaline phosphatase PafA n=1 Tax=Mangrovimonas sp. DI 80 TaxID=1779330 RepID=UPI0009779934|nr:alkaline phosphatase PafA [Mangrovimonas sp. DI 80]OMP30989.1 alkaline phosphatase [Mangrovimonas sp. DI 80]
MKNLVCLLVICAFCTSVRAQNNTENSILSTQNSQISKPKLVVGIIVDQMRYDYLTRYYNKYGEGGFKRLINEGFNCKNNHFNYIPTKTGPGHASVFTGTTPKYHGIIGNDWYDMKTREEVNCVQDDKVKPLGTKSDDGKKSPRRMLTTTFADENRLFTQMRGKTIGISVKHRGAILPAGHTANAAYWFDYDHNGTGNWISSTFYMEELPEWVKEFNKSGIAKSYFKIWDTLYDFETYTESGSDENNFERIFDGKKTSTFPYDLKALKSKNGGYEIIADSPYGNSLTTDFTLKAIDAEALGKDDITDVLTVSYSSTDKVGHDFGVNSKEIQDTYLRLDLELERLLNALDQKVGKGEYVVFLTADHAAPNVPAFLSSNKIPAGLFDVSGMFDEMNRLLKDKYSVSKLILSRLNNQLVLDHEKIQDYNLNLQEVKTFVANKLLTYELIDKVYITSSINQFEGPEGYLETFLANGHHQKRSGDILFVYTPGVFKDSKWNKTGTDHGTGFNYDTHVPLLFFGKGIKQGETLQRTWITDIAPTISALLGISLPNAAIGNPLEFVLLHD